MRTLFRGLAIGLLVGPISARAATITVDTVVDDTAANGNCTLREAVIAANTDAAVDGCVGGSGADTIKVPAGTYVLAIAGKDEDAAATGDLDITADVAILGHRATATIVDAAGIDRVFDVGAGSVVTLRELSVTGGAGIAAGGGIRNAGDLSLTAVEIRDNEVRPSLLASEANGGGIQSTGPLSLTDSTVADNGAFLYYPDGAFSPSSIGGSTRAAGGGIQSAGPLTVVGSTISGNVAIDDLFMLDVALAGGIESLGPATFVNSTISNNTAQFEGGLALSADTTFENCTIANNSSAHILGADGVTGVGIFTVAFRNTIIANNGLGNCAFGNDMNPAPTVIDDAYNLDSDGSCFSGATDIPGVDALLGPLEDNGGLTLTLMPGAGSPAIEAGSPATPGSGGTACQADDQRGLPRPGGARCDIGALEVGAPPPGDCDGDGRVTIDELIIGVRIALGPDPVARCPRFDRDRNQLVTVDELVDAVRASLEA